MSGFSDEISCPNCGNSCNEYHDSKPFNYITQWCDTCGLTINPVLSYMDLETINSNRNNIDLEPLDKLPEQKENLW